MAGGPVKTTVWCARDKARLFSDADLSAHKVGWCAAGTELQTIEKYERDGTQFYRVALWEPKSGITLSEYDPKYPEIWIQARDTDVSAPVPVAPPPVETPVPPVTLGSIGAVSAEDAGKALQTLLIFIKQYQG